MAKESYMHGGFFSPTGFFRVETGGKHEENPNGGVQIGVDEQGVPNMLEEGEPVYNDYVYSDNVTADASILKQFNIPEKYAGKLYSQIADSFVDEAEERPLDSVSNNGLRVMLSRLADAQEAQKEKQKEKELEDELASLSPEELAELEAMLSQEEAPVEETLVEQPQMMAMGGYIDDDDREKRAAAAMAEGAAAREAEQAEAVRLQAEAAAEAQRKMALTNAENKVKRLRRHVERDENKARQMEEGAKKVYPADRAAYKQTLLKQYGLIDYNKKRLADAEEYYNSLLGVSDSVSGVEEQPVDTTTVTQQVVTSSGIDWSKVRRSYSGGGLMNRFDGWQQSMLKIAKKATDGIDLSQAGKQKKANPYGFIFDGGVNPIVQAALAEQRARNVAAVPDKFDGYTSQTFHDGVLNPTFGKWRVTNSGSKSDEVEKRQKTYPTGMRYAAPIGHALLALSNIATPQTKFTYQRFIPQTVSGNLSLVDPRYQAVPMGMLMNETVTQGAGTIDALRNSGLGPSTGAAIVAADRSIGRNIGDTFLSGWQANNNQLNQIIGAINNNRQAAADFDYRLALANAAARERAQQSNIQNDLYVQRLNDAAESEKYAAISNELGYALEGLSGIGTENFNMNMANSVYPYVIDKQGRVRYVKPSAMGGLLKVYKG